MILSYPSSNVLFIFFLLLVHYGVLFFLVLNEIYDIIIKKAEGENMFIDINIPSEVETALNILNKNGFEAFIVGGCVRDSLLGSAPNDWDITTSAKPDEISMCFNKYRTINTGLKHGTVTVIINKMQLEITTYRIDGKYSDNRRPDNVLFTDDLSNDLKRRDFTINSLAYNKIGIVDLFGGIEDINNKLIKCVGNPDERFSEDGLRILRALRFASKLSFGIDNHTSISIHKNKNLLKNISKERISAELNKLIIGAKFHDIIMEYRDVIEVFIPEVISYNTREWENIICSMKYTADLVIRLALMLYKTDAEIVLRNLKYDGATIKRVKSIILYKDEEIKPDKIKLKKQLNIIGYENFIDLLKFQNAFNMADKNINEKKIDDLKDSGKLLNDIVLNNECYNLKMLAIDGKDLKKEGISKGITLGSILNEILILVIEEKLENKYEELIDYVRKYIKNKI